MDSTSASNLLDQAIEYLRFHPKLNGSLQFLLLVALLFWAYRLLMHEKMALVRAKLPWLQTIYARRRVRDLTKAGEYARAGDQLIELNALGEAARVFEKGKLLARAADVFVRMKRPEKAAAMYEQAGDFGRAAEIYMGQKQYDRAEHTMQKSGQEQFLGDLYLARDEKGRALAVYERLDQFEKAAALLKDMGSGARAAEMYLKVFEKMREAAGRVTGEPLSGEEEQILLEAARLYQTLRKFREAAVVFEKVGNKLEAARCYEKDGQAGKAAQLLEELGDVDEAARLQKAHGNLKEGLKLEGEKLIREGRHVEAVQKFQEAGEFARAAVIYHEDLADPDKAAVLYERASEYAMAAQLYKAQGRRIDAARAYERAGNLELAAAEYREAGQPEKEYSVLEAKGDALAMAENLQRRGLADEALAILEGIRSEDPRYRVSLSLKGRILLDQGDLDEARQAFESSLSSSSQIGEGDLETIYQLSVVEERSGAEPKAIGILEKMIARDLVAPEAVEKAQSMHKLLADRAYTQMSMLAQGSSKSDPFQTSAAVLQSQTSSVQDERYKTIKEIGRGGMGVVYLAKDQTLGRTVALKVLSSTLKTHKQAVATFLREGKSAAVLNHPNIVTVHDAGMQSGDYYIAMEFIEGQTVKEILRKHKKLSPPSVLEVMRQLLKALSYAHSKKVVHRDLTTNNIMWTSNKVVKIMDFGLAKVIPELMSEQSIVGGTPSYMSPEQTLGNPIDHRTDLYSLGICLFEMSLGRLPFTKGDLGYHHLHTTPPDPKEIDPQIPEVFAKTILKCMEKDPKDRFQSADEIIKLMEKPL